MLSHVERSTQVSDRALAYAKTLTPFAETIVQRPHQTIRPESGESTWNRSPESFLASMTDPRRTAFERRRTLGEGGFGVVWLANQVALGREVAIKSARSDSEPSHSSRKLLREAWITGALEHPNIVPVHDLRVSESGHPEIVMKRIEGVAWSKLMHDSDAVREQYLAEDSLAWNLGVLIQVANAIAFAHSQGILHRDIKPDNVMIGRFGEVYVVDWGIAVSLNDNEAGRLPLASQANELAGTPCYMAPEMLGEPKSRLCPQTDVYLLGSTLYEIATGVPPHLGQTLPQIIHSIFCSPPPLSDEVSPALEEVIQRAMALDPQERWSDATALRVAITQFLERRSSEVLTGHAERSLQRLQQLTRGEAGGSSRDDTLYDLFGECRFGFEQALREWPDNGRARVGLDSALIDMIDYELSQDDPRAAARLLGELEAPEPGLRERVEEQRKVKEEHLARLEKLSERLDPRTGARTRAFLGSILVGAWIVTPAALHFSIGFSYRHLDGIAFGALLLTISVALMFWARESLFKTTFNRSAAVLVLASALVLPLAHTAGLLLSLHVADVITFELLAWSMLGLGATLMLHRRFLLVFASLLLALVVAAAYPRLGLLSASACSTVLLGTILSLWGTALRPESTFRR